MFGDIGTSPLYAFHDGFNTEHHPIPVSPDNVLGLLSLVIWALIIVVSFKYVALACAIVRGHATQCGAGDQFFQIAAKPRHRDRIANFDLMPPSRRTLCMD